MEVELEADVSTDVALEIGGSLSRTTRYRQTILPPSPKTAPSESGLPEGSHGRA